MDRLPEEVEFEDLRKVPSHGFAWGLLQDDHVLGLNENSLAWIAQGAVQIDANGHLSTGRCPANDTDETPRRGADAGSEKCAGQINRIQPAGYHRATNQRNR